MTINLITFASLLHKQSSIRSSHEAILSELEKYFTVRFVNYEDIDKLSNDDFKIIFIATGGVERLVIQHFESLPRPAVILADGMQNSLAAALEVSSWLRNRGMKSEILHGELTSIIKRVHILYNNFQAQRSLFGVRIGVIGVTTGLSQTQAQKSSLTVADPVETVKNVLGQMSGKTDAVIVLAYTGSEDITNALAAIDGVSIVIESGASEAFANTADNGTVITSAGTKGNVIGVASLDINR